MSEQGEQSEAWKLQLKNVIQQKQQELHVHK